MNHDHRRPRSARAVFATRAVVGIVALVVVITAIVTVLVLQRNREGADPSVSEGTASATLVTSPYDLTEMPAGAGPDRVKDALLVSVFVPNESGTLTSYGMRADLPGAQALVKAVREAERVDPDVAAEELGSKAPESRLTFVLPSRQTLTFALYLDQGMIARDAEVWRPEGDLRGLIQAATTRPE